MQNNMFGRCAAMAELAITNNTPKIKINRCVVAMMFPAGMWIASNTPILGGRLAPSQGWNRRKATM
jgi:hypothetical protein